MTNKQIPKILITKPIPEQHLHLLKNFNLDIWNEEINGELSKEKLMTIIKDYDGIISMLSDQLDREVLEKASKLKIICQFAVGINNIDTEYCNNHSITVTNTPDVLTRATAELAFSSMLCVSRNIIPAYNNAKNGEWKGWEPKGFLGQSLYEKSLGLIGAGRIGSEFARLCKGAFNMKINYHGPNRKPDLESDLSATYYDLKELVQKSDILSLHCPLNQSSKNLLNEDIFKLLKKDVIIINTARGEVIDQDALYDFLKSNPLARAALDVTTPEPLSPSHKLYTLKNILILPHIGSATYEARGDMSLIVCKNMLRYFNNDVCHIKLTD